MCVSGVSLDRKVTGQKYGNISWIHTAEDILQSAWLITIQIIQR